MRDRRQGMGDEREDRRQGIGDGTEDRGWDRRQEAGNKG